MDKQQFFSMKVSEKVNYINKILKEGRTIKEFSKEIGVSVKTITKDFKHKNYEYSKKLRQYVICDGTNENITEIDLKITDKQKEDMMYIINNADRIRDILEGDKDVYFKDITDSNIDKKESLIKEVYRFKQTKRNYITKTLKIDEEIHKEFVKLWEEIKDSNINQQELLNYILLKYIEYYRSKSDV